MGNLGTGRGTGAVAKKYTAITDKLCNYCDSVWALQTVELNSPRCLIMINKNAISTAISDFYAALPTGAGY